MRGFFKLAGKKYEKIIDTHGTGIKQVAYSYVKDRQIAEDITQETFIRCLTKGRNFKGDSALKTWLYRIAINLCKDYLKSSYQQRVTINNELVDAVGTESPSAEEITIKHEDTSNLTEYILTLPEQYREIVVLFYFKEFKVTEMAEILGISENTVKTRLRRARELLKEGMSDNG